MRSGRDQAQRPFSNLPYGVVLKLDCDGKYYAFFHHEGMLFLWVIYLFCDVVVDIENNQLNKTFEYIVPPHLESIIEVGFRVKVPFGRRNLLGFVVNIKDNSEFEEKKNAANHLCSNVLSFVEAKVNKKTAKAL